MGGWNSGRRGGTACTDSCRAIDIRRWQRDGLLVTGRWFNWQWTQDGEAVANINVQAESGRVVLQYRIRKNGSDWPLCKALHNGHYVKFPFMYSDVAASEM